MAEDNHPPISIATFIRDNTDDGRNIVRFLIDVTDGDLEGCSLSHRLAAARLLTVYGHKDAPDFIADNTPDKDETKNGRRIWLEIDEGLRTLIQTRTDDGRVIRMFLIDVMEGKCEGAHVGHRVSAARELLNRAFGKTSFPRKREPGRPLPKSKSPTTPRRPTRKNQKAPETTTAATTSGAPTMAIPKTPTTTTTDPATPSSRL